MGFPIERTAGLQLNQPFEGRALARVSRVNWPDVGSLSRVGGRRGSVDWGVFVDDPFLPVGFLQSGLTHGDGSFVFRFYEAAVRDVPQPARIGRSPER